MRKSWTDERLDDMNRRIDDMNRRMDDGFNRVDADLRALRSETTMRFERVEGRIDDLHDTIHRTMLQLGGGAIVTIVVGFAGLIATQL